MSLFFNMKKYIILIIVLFFINSLVAQNILARVHYSGGGDWYNDPEVLLNLANFYNETTNSKTFEIKEKKIKLTSAELWQQPFIFITGHGNLSFSKIETKNLKKYLLNGGFLYVDDDYGLNKSFRKEINKIFPNKELIELGKNHEIFNSYFKFNNGLPKVHKHNDKRPQIFAVFDNFGRIMILYTYESNISDGWANPETHKDSKELREKALQFGVNILSYVFKN